MVYFWDQMQMVFYCIYIQIGSYIIIKFFNSASK